MSMISMNDLFYGRRESVLILKDENRELLETIHRYNYFYAEPPPKPSEDEGDPADLVEQSADSADSEGASDPRDSEPSPEKPTAAAQDADKKDGNEDSEKKVNAPEQDGRIAFKVPICCNGCEEAVTIALRRVPGVEDVQTVLRQGRVIVTGTAAPADLLLACRDVKLFRKTKFWSDDVN